MVSPASREKIWILLCIDRIFRILVIGVVLTSLLIFKRPFAVKVELMPIIGIIFLVVILIGDISSLILKKEPKWYSKAMGIALLSVGISIYLTYNSDWLLLFFSIILSVFGLLAVIRDMGFSFFFGKDKK